MNFREFLGLRPRKPSPPAASTAAPEGAPRRETDFEIELRFNDIHPEWADEHRLLLHGFGETCTIDVPPSVSRASHSAANALYELVRDATRVALGRERFEKRGFGDYAETLVRYEQTGVAAFNGRLQHLLGSTYKQLFRTAALQAGISDAFPPVQKDEVPQPADKRIVKSTVKTLAASAGLQSDTGGINDDIVFFGHGGDHRSLSPEWFPARAFYVNLDRLNGSDQNTRMVRALELLDSMGSNTAHAALRKERTDDRERK